MKTVAVGELRRNLSKYLKRVGAGERLVVTDRNRPIAELGPLRDGEAALASLIAEGVVRPGPRRGSSEPFRPITVKGDSYAGTRALDEVRGDE